jgi:hypothetical protein
MPFNIAEEASGIAGSSAKISDRTSWSWSGVRTTEDEADPPDDSMEQLARSCLKVSMRPPFRRALVMVGHPLRQVVRSFTSLK